MSIKNSKNWRIEDPCVGIALGDIHPTSLRAQTVLARSSSKLLHTHFVQIAGVVSILSGLEYHHDRFMKLLGKLVPGPFNDYSSIRHEAVAWVNRVGQLYYFIKSELVVENVGDLATPMIDSIIPFRHKHTAHRSLDNPRPEDTAHLQMVHAMSLSDEGGMLWTPRPGFSGPLLKTPPTDTHFVTFQLQMPGDQTNNSVVELVIERDHQVVTREGYMVFESLLKSPNDQT